MSGASGRLRVASSQFIADQFAFVLNTSLVSSIHHARDERKAFRTTGAFLDGVEKLCDANRAGDLSVFVFEIEVARTHRAFRVVDVSRSPVAGEVAGRSLLRETAVDGDHQH